MARTMVANIPGARLRDAEHQLALLKGEEAVAAFLAAHPNEMKVLQQLVDWRRAGRSAPSLARIQQAMLWSDGAIEFRTEPAAGPAAPAGEPARAAGLVTRGAGRDGGSRPGAGGPPPLRGARPQARAGTGASRRPSRAAGGHGRPLGSGRPTGSFFVGRPEPVLSPEGAPSGPPPARRTGRGAARRGQDGEADDLRGVPVAGEGWALVRAGEAPPDAAHRAEQLGQPGEPHEPPPPALERQAVPHSVAAGGAGEPADT